MRKNLFHGFISSLCLQCNDSNCCCLYLDTRATPVDLKLCVRQKWKNFLKLIYALILMFLCCATTSLVVVDTYLKHHSMESNAIKINIYSYILVILPLIQILSMELIRASFEIIRLSQTKYVHLITFSKKI